VNLAVVLMGVAAGIGILASLQHGLVGLSRRPRDRARIAFAAAALAAAVAALAVAALYSVDDIGDHVAVAKWAFYPASVLWTLATVWFVAFASGVRPRWLLATLSAGFTVAIAVDLVLPHGMLHATIGTLVHARVLGASVLVMRGSGPNGLHVLTDVLTVLSFGFMCYAVYRVYRRPVPAADRARFLGPMTALLAVATLLDTINEHSIITTFTTLYLTQVCFALVVVAVSLALRQESLQVETELRAYRTQMDALVEARVAELDEAKGRLVVEARERRATEDVLRRRMEELEALQRMAQILGGQTARREAIDEATSAIARLFKARYARVRLLADGETDDDRAAPDSRPGPGAPPGEGVEVQPLTLLDLAASDAALGEAALIAGDAVSWPDLPDELRRQAGADGVGSVLATPLTATSGAAGALVIVRDRSAGAFSDEELALARTVGDALAAVIEIDRLHREETRQAAEQERQALARDLHDAVTQSIYSASLIAEALPAVWERDPEDGRRNLERLRRLTRAALAEMRTLLFELRPSALETAPLDALIERLGDALAGQAQIDVDIEVDDVDLPPDVKIAFYRVTQEAFSNVAKHARASAVSARVLAVDGGATLTVQDDGRGFDPGAVPSGHMGLHIMNERLERVAATLRVDSAPGAGTTIHAAWLQPASDERPLERMGA
jgi:signal transduction histidine kinase